MTFIHVSTLLMITPFRQILKGVIPNLRGFDRKIFGCFFVHFAKIVKSPIGTAEPVQIAESRHLINFSQFTWINSFAREIPAPQFLY